MSLNRIKSALGPKGWLDDEGDTLKYRTDWRGGSVADALGVARPADTATAAAVIRLAREAGIALVPQGGNTGLVLGSIPTEARPTIILSTDRLTRVRELDAGNYALVAEAGCVVAHLQACAAEVGRLLPLSLASEGSCTIGGALSTNAGGNQTIRFGNTREQILGLEVVLPDGTVLDGLNTLRKNNTGYDLKHLFIGAEGTLGFVTAAAIRLMPAPRRRETALLAVTDPHAALKLLELARALSGDLVLAFELMPRASIDLALENIEGVVDPLEKTHAWYVLLEMATPSEIDNLREKLERIVGDAMEAGLVTDGVLAESEAQRASLWRPREEQAEAGRRAGPALNFDVSVPVARVAEFLDTARAAMAEILPGVSQNTFGHVGDGNIHYGLRRTARVNDAAWAAATGPLSERLIDIVMEFGGSFSAEHGIGAQKRDILARYAQPERLALMRTIKQALDPDGLMNPGKIF